MDHPYNSPTHPEGTPSLFEGLIYFKVEDIYARRQDRHSLPSTNTYKSLVLWIRILGVNKVIRIHFVRALASRLSAHILRIELEGDIDIQISVVLLTGPVFYLPCYGFTFLDCEHVVKIEHCLLPVRVFCVWACRKANRLVAG